MELLRKTVSGVMLTLLLVGMLALSFNIQPVRASGTIYIRADGSIDPPDAPISTVDNVTYALTGNVTSDADGIVVERDNIIIDGAGCTVEGTGIEGRGFFLYGITNVTIKKTNIRSFFDGISLTDSSNNSISENKITNNKYGIMLLGSLLGSSNNSISGNNLTNKIIGIMLDESSNNRISENKITNSGFWGGIWLDHSSNNSIVGNDITNNRQYGIRLWQSSNNGISGNRIANNNESGISFVGGDSYNSIFGNNITANNDCGIMLGSSSNYNSISGNNITRNENGIELYSSSNNSIAENSITNNSGGGIYLYRSSNNRFWHNNFIDNTQQVHVEPAGYANVWDDGYPSGGNYWSDYTDVDQYSGPYQNETGSDGIWDHPYIINENNQDNYPIVPEFPTWTSILLIFIVLTVVIAIYKRRLENSISMRCHEL